MKIQTNTLKSIPLWGTAKKDLLWTIFLASASIIAPSILAHTPANQLATGITVNMILFIASWRLGIMNALLIGILPSSVALLRGLLPAPMALLIPYIILSNAIMVVTFSFLKEKLLTAVIFASLAKSSFLFLVSLFFFSKIASPFVSMLQLPQLLTALGGGFLAIGVIATLKAVKK